jgi:hypothetical protein
MAKRMSDEKLATILEKAISNSEHIHDGSLAKERQTVAEYYRGDQPRPLHKGDSKYVSRDVFDAVDSMRATVIEAFLANTRIVYFRPEKGETVDGSKQATEYCRHVFFKDNAGEDIMYDVLTDGLQNRFSVVKVRFEELTEDEEYDFEGLTPEELTLQVSGYTDFEFKEGDLSENGLMSGTFVVKKTSQKIVVEVIQPEDLMVSSRCADLSLAKYIIHRTEASRSTLIKQGYDRDKIDQIEFGDGDSDLYNEAEKHARFAEIDDVIAADDELDKSSEEIVLYETYIRLDMEGNGTNDLWKVCYAGGVVLDYEKVSRMPFASFVPLPRPHTFMGENFAQSVIPVQNARTVLIRQIINHSLITNNPRHQVVSGTLRNPAELLENRMGGVVNVTRPDGISPIPQAPLNPFIFNLISMIDEDKEEVTGISKLSQGMNKDAISTQNSQGMVEQLIGNSQQRTKIVSRRFGKFLKDLYGLIYHIAADHIDEAEYTEVTGNFVKVNPKEWHERTAASIELTLGYAEAQQESDKWSQIDQYLANDPEMKAGYGYDKRYEVLSRAFEHRGIEDLHAILTPPQEMKPPEPSEAEQMQMEQMRTQIEYQKAQSQSMVMKAESDRLKAQADLIRAQSDAAHKKADTMLDSTKFEHEVYMDIEELEAAKALPQESAKATFNPNE